MICSECRVLRGAYLDNELDPRSSVEVNNHLQGCARCSADLTADSALGDAVRMAGEYFQPSQQLRHRIELSVGRRPGWRRAMRWRRAAVPLTLAAAVLVVLLPTLRRGRATPEAEIVSAHVRSLQVDHLMDVTSSDRHTVKPWFQGKLDYSLTVQDYAKEGFPLSGGRLDYVAAAPVAALVYRHDNHIINLFVWADPGVADSPPMHARQRGFEIVHWNQSGMNHWAISDLNAADLGRFTELVKSAP